MVDFVAFCNLYSFSDLAIPTFGPFYNFKQIQLQKFQNHDEKLYKVSEIWSVMFSSDLD